MRLPSRWRSYLLRSPVYLLLSRPTAATLASTGEVEGKGDGGKRLMRHPARGFKAGGSVGGGGGGGSKDWLRLVKRRIAVACRPRNLARIVGGLLVAALLVILVTKGFGLRRRGGCKCTLFTYSQCQPYDADRGCGPGTKKAFCQQKRCKPRRKRVRCTLPCENSADGQAAAAESKAEAAAAAAGLSPACVYSIRRQSRWTHCTEGAKHRSRVLFLQPDVSAPDCPATKTERRRCMSKPRKSRKGCIYEPRGEWSQCDRQRNVIVNMRKLTGGRENNCPPEVTDTLRCLKRDGTLKCIYTKWSKWSRCVAGIRYKTRSLVQGEECYEATRLVQNCLPTL